MATTQHNKMDACYRYESIQFCRLLYSTNYCTDVNTLIFFHISLLLSKNDLLKATRMKWYYTAFLTRHSSTKWSNPVNIIHTHTHQTSLLCRVAASRRCCECPLSYRITYRLFGNVTRTMLAILELAKMVTPRIVVTTINNRVAWGYRNVINGLSFSPNRNRPSVRPSVHSLSFLWSLFFLLALSINWRGSAGFNRSILA